MWPLGIDGRVFIAAAVLRAKKAATGGLPIVMPRLPMRQRASKKIGSCPGRIHS